MKKFVLFLISVLSIIIMCSCANEGEVIVQEEWETFVYPIEPYTEQVKKFKKVVLYEEVEDKEKYYTLKREFDSEIWELSQTTDSCSVQCTKLIQYDNYFEIEICYFRPYILTDKNGNTVLDSEGKTVNSCSIDFCETFTFSNDKVHYKVVN